MGRVQQQPWPGQTNAYTAGRRMLSGNLPGSRAAYDLGAQSAAIRVSRPLSLSFNSYRISAPLASQTSNHADQALIWTAELKRPHLVGDADHRKLWTDITDGKPTQQLGGPACQTPFFVHTARLLRIISDGCRSANLKTPTVCGVFHSRSVIRMGLDCNTYTRCSLRHQVLHGGLPSRSLVLSDTDLR
ncbi:hypothetical protein G7K_1650-t2 [Saitoella complicata NRRL Y-17804]|uniref:Uncharacterized protein n=1 Tax=Saitoella complicata (strain BCRC 22490 / CBS 7301 / JCM 7358 / NBRC 10748 / NRRL Y-17804) TaxID=698492 RepID=A0A0E9NC54_SAICN|nr:hypothetical protein G7K_1650-t2 [Saitoella complicata NRRL Y-17804]